MLCAISTCYPLSIHSAAIFFKGPLHPARMFCHSSQLFSVDSSEQVLEAAKDAGHPCNGTAGAACASREGLRQAKGMRE